MALDISNLKILRESLHSVHRKWHDIGLALDLHPDSLNNIASNCNSDTSRGLREMLTEWLKQVDPVPTWESVVKALENCTVGEKHLALQLKDKHCNQQSLGNDEFQPVVSPVACTCLSVEARLQKLEKLRKRSRTDVLVCSKCKRSFDDCIIDITEAPTVKRAKCHVEVSSSGSFSFELTDLGSKTHISTSAIPPRQSDAKLKMKFSLSMDNHTTGDSHELFSAEHWVDSPVDPQKPVITETKQPSDPLQPPPKIVTVPILQEELSESLVEVAPMILADEKSSPHPYLPPETHQYSQPLHPQETGYDVELVKEDPDMLCLICLFVLHDPVQITCCGKRFCRACIEVWITKAKKCPACNCKAGNFDIFEDKATKQIIFEVKVHCSNRELGCGWKGELCQLDSHLNLDTEKGKMDLGCQYVQLKCIHCSEDCQRHHMRSCPQQPYTCPYCKHYSSTYENVNKYHLSECDELPVQCKMCSMKILQKSIQQHELWCSRNQDLQQSTAMPLKIDTIESPSPVFVPPPTFVMNNFTNYKENRESWLSPPFYSHIGGYKLCLSVDAHGLGECSGTHVSVYMHLQCGEYDDSLAWPFTGSVTIQLVNRRRDEGHMERTLNFNEHTPAKNTCRVAEGESGDGWGYNDFMPNSALQYDENWNTEYLTNDSIEFRITQVKLSVTAEGLPAEAHNLIPPVDIVMNNFSTHKICDDSWFSPPFYSHTGGYKLCLSIHANGNKSGAGTHTSVFVRLMRGEHDDNLKWPFTGDIEIQLVNQRKNKEHEIVERTINFTESASADRVTEGERGSGIGLFQFISHSALYCAESSSPSYLKNDCLVFRITQVKLIT